MSRRKNLDKTAGKNNSKGTPGNDSVQDIEYVKDRDYIDDAAFMDDVGYVDVDADLQVDDTSKTQNKSKETPGLLEALKGNYSKPEENIVQLDSIRSEKEKKNNAVSKSDAQNSMESEEILKNILTVDNDEKTRHNLKKTETKAGKANKTKKNEEVKLKTIPENEAEKNEEIQDKVILKNEMNSEKTNKQETIVVEEKNTQNDMDTEKKVNSVNSDFKGKRLKNIGEEINKVSIDIENKNFDNTVEEKKSGDDNNQNTKEKAKGTKKSSKSKSSMKPISFTERMMENSGDNVDTENAKNTKEIKLGILENDIRMEEYVRPESKQLKKVISDDRKKEKKENSKEESDDNEKKKKQSKDTIRIYQKRRADNGTTFVWNDTLSNQFATKSDSKNEVNFSNESEFKDSADNNADIYGEELSEGMGVEYLENNITKILHLKIVNRLFQLIKWLLVSVFIGVVVGIVGVAFAKSMTFVTNFRTNNDWIIYFLPVGGIAIVYIYRKLHFKNDKGTNTVIAAIRAEEDIPIKMAPFIFVSTIITHLLGGSSGREGAALQLGGSIGNQLGKFINLDEKDRRVVLMAGMSAAFSAVFGTPIAAAIFSMEMASVGIMYYAAFVPCAIASLVASELATAFGVQAELFKVLDIPDLNILIAGKIVLLAVCCAVISVLFCMMLHLFSDYSKKIFKNPYVRIVLGAVIILGLALLLDTRDYMGAGINIIENAMKGEVKPEAFALKMLFTAVTLGVGYRGGEIVPSFFVGATFGCLFGQIFNFSPSFCAALGMVAVFCGVTNCPITSLLISFELFGYKGVYYFLLTVPISYMMSGYSSLYGSQKIMYSKFKTQYINKMSSK